MLSIKMNPFSHFIHRNARPSTSGRPEATPSTSLPADTFKKDDRPPTTFLALPQDIHFKIMNHISIPEDRHQEFEMLLLLKQINKEMKARVDGYDRFNRLKNISGQMKRFWDAFASQPQNSLRPSTPPFDAIHAFEAQLPLRWMSPGARHTFVNGMLNLPSNPNWIFYTGAELSALVPHMDELTPEQRDKVFKSMLGYAKKAQIKCLMPGLKHLSGKQRGQLVNNFLNSKDERARARAFRILGANLQYFDPDQRKKLFRDATHFKNKTNQATAIGGLGAGLEYLEPKQREKLFNIATTKFVDDNKAIALGGLGSSIKSLKPDQRVRLVELIFNLQPEQKKIALRGLVVSLPDLTLEQRSALIQNTLHLPEGLKALILPEFGPRLKHLTRQQRSALVEATLNLRNHRLRADAIQGLINGLEALEPEQHQAVIDAALSFPSSRTHPQDPDNPNDTFGGALIGKLGSKLQYLKPDQRTILHDAAIHRKSAYNKAQAIGGLGAGLQYFIPDQRKSLVSAVSDIAALDKDNQLNTAVAIKGLGHGLKYLLPPEQDQLTGLAMNLSNTWHKAIAINGLVSGLMAMEPTAEETTISTTA